MALKNTDLLPFREQGFQRAWRRTASSLENLLKGFYVLKLSGKKHILILIAIGLLYFFGIAAIVYPIIGNMYSMSTSKNTIESYVSDVVRMDDSDIEERFENARKYNQDLAKMKYDDGLEHCLDVNDEGLVCYVEIPSLAIYLPVYYGTSSEVLLKGCGILENTSLPVGGKNTHSSISGHTGLPDAEMFTKLDKMSVGDMFYIHVYDRSLAYKVDNIETVTPNDTKHLLIVPDEDHVTLLTCTPYGINDKRLLVRGVRVEEIVKPSDETSAGRDNTSLKDAASRADSGLQKQIDQSMWIIILIFSVAVVVYVGACVWISLKFRRGRVRAKYARKSKRAEGSNGKKEK